MTRQPQPPDHGHKAIVGTMPTWETLLKVISSNVYLFAYMSWGALINGVSAVHSNWLDRLKVLRWSGYREGRKTEQKSTKRTDSEPEEKVYGSLCDYVVMIIN
ncbi:UNVERIFIED_CONTAM: hypothetical protein NCL1_22597 [Trichonephila clavipes]